MIFISYAQLVKDIVAWSEELPRDLDVIVGVPRSGMVPAAVLALHRNVRLTSVDDLRDGRVFLGGFRDQHRKLKKGLVLDDSILTGKSIFRAGDALKGVKGIKLFYGGVYLKPGAESTAYLHCRKVQTPRIFEWNWLHSCWITKACMDIDGVLCRDPTKEENDDGLRYRKFLHTVAPRHIPTVEVHTLVTSRLEKYRMDTVKWLQRHGVLFKNLIMHPAATKKERQKAGDHAKRKAIVYRQSGYPLFIESSTKQAQAIAQFTGKPVLCTDSMSLYQ